MLGVLGDGVKGTISGSANVCQHFILDFDFSRHSKRCLHAWYINIHAIGSIRFLVCRVESSQEYNAKLKPISSVFALFHRVDASAVGSFGYVCIAREFPFHFFFPPVWSRYLRSTFPCILWSNTAPCIKLYTNRRRRCHPCIDRIRIVTRRYSAYGFFFSRIAIITILIAFFPPAFATDIRISQSARALVVQNCILHQCIWWWLLCLAIAIANLVSIDGYYAILVSKVLVWSRSW